MNFVALLKLFLQLSNFVASYVSDEKLMDAGEARLIRKQLDQLDDRLKKSDTARRDTAADNAAGGLLSDDGHKRD